MKKKKSKTKFHYCEETDCYFEKKNFFAIVVVKEKVKLLCEITTLLQQQQL